MDYARKGSNRRRVLVTGGSGFIGTNVVEKYLQDAYDVLNVDISPPKIPAHRAWWTATDILDRAGLLRVVSTFHPNLVIHLAAKTVLNERTDLAFYAANIEGVQNTIDAIQAAGSVERTFFASSRLVSRLGHIPSDDTDYRPGTLYGESKVQGEQLVRAASPALGTWTIVRPTGIWGPWFGVPYRDFFRRIEAGKYVHPAGRDALKSYGYVENTVHEIQQLALRPAESIHGLTLVLADYPPVSVRTWAMLIQRELGAGPIRSVPTPILKAVAFVGDEIERLRLGTAPLTSFRLNNLVSDMVYDTTALEDLVGPLPFTVAEGVARTVAWLHGPGAAEADPRTSRSTCRD